LARLSISSACAGFNAVKAALIAGILREETGYDIGVEVLVPKNSTHESLVERAEGAKISSIHAPFMLLPSLFDLRKQFERAVWNWKLAPLEDACKLAHQLGVPIVVHSDTILRLRARGNLTAHMFGDARVLVENTEPMFALGEPLDDQPNAIQELLASGHRRIGVCLDFGHLAMAAFRKGSWTGEAKDFVERVLDPQMCTLQSLDVMVEQVHIHDFDHRDTSDKPDHKRLGDGQIPVAEMIGVLCNNNAHLLAILEVNYLGSQWGYIRNTLTGWGDKMVLEGIRKDFATLVAAVPKGVQLIKASPR